MLHRRLKINVKSHSELAIKVEKLPFAFPEELSSFYRIAVKKKPMQKARCREEERPRTSKKSPSHKAHTPTSTQMF